MLRHPLAALFEPHSLLILSSRELPVAHACPPFLADHVAEVRIGPDGAWTMPPALPFLQAGDRLDLALLCVDPGDLTAILAALVRFRPRALVLLPHERPSDDPARTHADCQAWGQRNDCLVLGPGSLGIQRPHLGLNLGLDPYLAPAGRVALVAQSRMVAAAVLDWADDIDLGFSAVASAGDAAGVTVAEILDYLAMDDRTESIVLYLEQADSSRAFTSALMAAASVKPVIVLKTGRQGVQREPAADAVFDALVRRTGAVRIRFFIQLFSALKVLVHARRQQGRRIALVSNGHGAAHLALDVIRGAGPVTPAEFSTETQRQLQALLEPGAAVANPVVTHAPLRADRLQAVLQTVTADRHVDGVLVLMAPDVLSDLPAVSDTLATFSEAARKPVLSCFLGDAVMRPLRHRLDQVGLPAFRTPESAADAYGILASYHYNQVLARQALPPEMLSLSPRLDEARILLSDALMTGRTVLDAPGSQWLLDCFHVPIQRAEAPLPDAVRASIPMAIHVRRDGRFGPYLQFGPGGRYARLAPPHREIELPPLNNYLARQLIQRGQFWSQILERELSSAAFEQLREALERISEIACELPSIESLSIDPLWSDDTHLIAGHIEVRLDPRFDGTRPGMRAYRHMAIHPYPRQLVQSKVTRDGREWLLRPIRPEDASLLQEFVRDLSDETRYMRFVSMLRELTPGMLARYTRIDYDRELALVATAQVPNPKNRGLLRERIVGFAHYLRNGDGLGAEYALVIADDWQRCGLGAALMRSLLDAARRQGLRYVEGFVMASNQPMLTLMGQLGLRNDPAPADPTLRRAWMSLDTK